MDCQREWKFASCMRIWERWSINSEAETSKLFPAEPGQPQDAMQNLKEIQ